MLGTQLHMESMGPEKRLGLKSHTWKSPMGRRYSNP